VSPLEIGKPIIEPEKALAQSTRALIVGPYLTDRAALKLERASSRGPEARLEEAAGLALAIDLDVIGHELAMLSQIRPATFLGKGKVEEIAEQVKHDEIGLVMMDCALSPVQQRNLEKAFGAKVIDRTGLILEIFGRRARTREGALQVELAHLNYQKSRLVRSWTHLERQRGGFGFLGGPGETQIETDRRLIQERMTRIERDLEAVKKTRGLHRKSRQDVPFPVVALVGYTNAGKSTLFNRLTRAEVLAT
jgi:GTP-binding protein HflX